MTLDYTKMFLIVTEEAVVKGHFTSVCTGRDFEPVWHVMIVTP